MLGNCGMMFQEQDLQTENDTQPNYQLKMTASVCVLNSENIPFTHHCLERSSLHSPCLHSPSNTQGFIHTSWQMIRKSQGCLPGVGHMPIPKSHTLPRLTRDRHRMSSPGDWGVLWPEKSEEGQTKTMAFRERREIPLKGKLPPRCAQITGFPGNKLSVAR